MGASKNSQAAFIDLDGTLCEIFLWQALFRHHREHRFKIPALYAFIAFHMPLWLLYRARVLSQQYFYRVHAINLAWLVRGVSVERANQIWSWVVEKQLVPNLRPEMLARVRSHLSQGHRVILLSGSFAPVLDKLVIHLGLERAIATQLAVKKGVYTGKIVPPYSAGEGKVQRLRQFLEAEGREIDLAASFFYTDSILDAPVLDLIGHPVAVHPDPELARLAAERGWLTIGVNPAA